MNNTPEQQQEANRRWNYRKNTEIVSGKIIGSQQPYFYTFNEKFVLHSDEIVWPRFASGLAYSDESAEEWCKTNHPEKYAKGVLMEKR
jgi:hypothetical protein